MSEVIEQKKQWSFEIPVWLKGLGTIGILAGAFIGGNTAPQIISPPVQMPAEHSYMFQRLEEHLVRIENKVERKYEITDAKLDRIVDFLLRNKAAKLEKDGPKITQDLTKETFKQGG